MSLFLLILLIGVPLIEIYLFILVGGTIGAGWTVLAIIATAVFGLSLMRRQGLAVLREAQAAQARGQPPIAEAAHGIFILLAGALLLTPGFMTDGLGFLLLWRGFRLFLIASLLEAALAGLYAASFTHKPPDIPDMPDIIEGEYWTKDENKKDP